VHKRYCVIFLSLIKEQDSFSSAMSRLGVDSVTVSRILQKAPVIMKSNMPLDEARRYAGAVHRAGGMVRIKEEGQNENEEACPSKKIIALENFIMCPRCGYKQLKEPSCKRCGLPFDSV
jgi:hypothetical protein